jgi:2-oxoacid:acceptor oxidoreductase gamma subunit (pyruvate/2-ketoisovalerate family)
MAFLFQETFMHEIIWHGRGGQGVVVAAQILAEAAYLQGYKGVTSAPTFGPERRGAPLTASTRISDTPLRTFSQIEHADIAVVLDSSLVKVVDIQSSVKDGGLIIINTDLPPDAFQLRSGLKIAVVDAVKIALKFHLLKEGAPIVNTPLLGSFARAAGLVSLEYIEKGLKKKLPAKVVAANSMAVNAAYEQTIIKDKKAED